MPFIPKKKKQTIPLSFHTVRRVAPLVSVSSLAVVWLAHAPYWFKHSTGRHLFIRSPLFPFAKHPVTSQVSTHSSCSYTFKLYRFLNLQPFHDINMNLWYTVRKSQWQDTRTQHTHANIFVCHCYPRDLCCFFQKKKLLLLQVEEGQIYIPQVQQFMLFYLIKRLLNLNRLALLFKSLLKTQSIKV